MSALAGLTSQRGSRNDLTPQNCGICAGAGFMIPAAATYGVPGADDEAIFADIVRSLGRDRTRYARPWPCCTKWLAAILPALDDAEAEAAAMALLGGVTRRSRHSDAPCCNATTATTAWSVAGPRATPAFPEGPCSGAGRLVATGRRAAAGRGCGATWTAREAEMAAAEDPDAPRPADEIVDVLIIGSGASGAAVAWGLAETRMKILCLEQGDWIKPTDFPSQRPRLGSAPLRRFRHQPEPPRARHRLSGQRRQFRDEDRQLQRRRRRHDPVHRALPAHAPVRLSRANARRRGGRLADRLLDARTVFRRERPHDGRRRPGGRPCLSAARAHHAAGSAWQDRHALCAGDEQARLALVAIGHRHGDDRVRWSRASASISAIARRDARKAPRRVSTSPIGRGRSAPAWSCARAAACARSPPTSTAWHPASIYYDPNGAERFQPAEVVILAANGIGTPRLLLNSASSRFPNGLANSSGLVGRNLMLHPWPQVFGYVEEEMDGDRGPQTVMWSKEFYETDPSRGFVRGYTLQFGRGTGPAMRRSPAWRRPPAVGQGPSSRLSHAASTGAC